MLQASIKHGLLGLLFSDGIIMATDGGRTLAHDLRDGNLRSSDLSKDADKPDPESCSDKQADSLHQGGRVLLVDDDDGIRNVAKRFFEYAKAPFHIDYARDGDEGYKKWRDACHTHNAYDLVILDVIMPGMNGLKCADKMREDDDCEVKIIFWTGDESPLVDMRAHRVQAIMVLPKVIDLKLLMSFICSALYRKPCEGRGAHSIQEMMHPQDKTDSAA